MAGRKDHSCTRRKVAASIAVVLGLAVAVSCSGDDPGAAPAPPTPSPIVEPAPTTSTSPTERAEAVALDAYVGMWMAMAKAGETADWESPELAKYATGNALTTITRSLYADYKNGIVSKGKPVLDPRVTARDPEGDPTTIRLADCGDSTNWLQYHADSGDPVDDEPGGRRAIQAEIKQQADGTWKVSRFAVQGLGSC